MYIKINQSLKYIISSTIREDGSLEMHSTDLILSNRFNLKIANKI